MTVKSHAPRRPPADIELQLEVNPIHADMYTVVEQVTDAGYRGEWLLTNVDGVLGMGMKQEGAPLKAAISSIVAGVHSLVPDAVVTCRVSFRARGEATSSTTTEAVWAQCVQVARHSAKPAFERLLDRCERSSPPESQLVATTIAALSGFRKFDIYALTYEDVEHFCDVMTCTGFVSLRQGQPADLVANGRKRVQAVCAAWGLLPTPREERAAPSGGSRG